jgi:hypothetical protein
MLTPNHVVTTARAVLALGAVTVAVLTLGPFQGAEQIFGLTDKAAHAIAFGGLTAISFAAFPRMRRADLARTALILGAGIEVAQLFGHRSASIMDWGADASGRGDGLWLQPDRERSQDGPRAWRPAVHADRGSEPSPVAQEHQRRSHAGHAAGRRTPRPFRRSRG